MLRMSGQHVSLTEKPNAKGGLEGLELDTNWIPGVTTSTKGTAPSVDVPLKQNKLQWPKACEADVGMAR
jgi:hypothetical protein